MLFYYKNNKNTNVGINIANKLINQVSNIKTFLEVIKWI
tara:strand:- start:526 stop:642 length:117 start_codon:yes stop_codon:yes gene_type:complete